MPLVRVTPTDQTAFATATELDPPSTDDCASSPATGTQNGVTLFVSYDLTTARDSGMFATAKVQYSTNSGGSWVNRDVVINGASSSGTDAPTALGDGVDLSQIKVRASADAGGLGGGTASATSQIIEWYITYRVGRRIYRTDG